MQVDTPPIYLDFAAATPCDPRVFAVMQPFFDEQFYNPSSAYMAAKKVRESYEHARANLARHIGVKAHEIIMTAGATESINIGLQGILRTYPGAKVAVSVIEHQAVMAVAKAYPHTTIATDSHGMVSEDTLKAAIDDDIVVVSVGMVNSEIGARQPIKQLSAAIREIQADRVRRGVATPLYFHTDASQAAGSLDLSVSRLGVDMMTLSAGKMYGPKQTGMLYVRRGIQLTPLIYGGGQERALRSGTEDVAAAVGFAKAFDLAEAERTVRVRHVKDIRRLFLSIISEELSGVECTVPEHLSAPHILHFTVKDIDAERLLLLLDENGVMVSTGAACAASQQSASYSLQALGWTDKAIAGSVRCSFSHMLDEKTVRRAAEIFVRCVVKMRTV